MFGVVTNTDSERNHSFHVIKFESRRISRFWDHGHTQETIEACPWSGIAEHYITQDRILFKTDVPPVEVNNEYPCALDMRMRKSRKRPEFEDFIITDKSLLTTRL